MSIVKEVRFDLNDFFFCPVRIEEEVFVSASYASGVFSTAQPFRRKFDYEVGYVEQVVLNE